MNGLINGIYNLCSALQPLAGAILVLMIIIGGISTMVDGAEGRGRNGTLASLCASTREARESLLG